MGRRAWLVLLWLLGACSGQIGQPGTSGGAEKDSDLQAPATAIPRLSRREIEATIEDVFGLSGLALSALPPDPDVAVNPSTNAEETIFDTFAGTLGTYTPSEVFVQGLSSLASEVAARVSADRGKVAALAGCEPTGGDDEGCMRAFIDEL